MKRLTAREAITELRRRQADLNEEALADLAAEAVIDLATDAPDDRDCHPINVLRVVES